MIKKKSLGQNFLKSQKVIDDIVVASGTKKGSVVLEIGPGEGVLTGALLATGAKAVSVEKDDRLISALSEKFSEEIASGQFQLIHADILNLNMSKTVFDKYKIVANIPYYITGQVIRKFLEVKNQPESMTLLLQKEVAERIIAKDNKESLLSLSVKAYGTPKYIRAVPRGAFIPQPNVDSAVIHISGISRKNFDNLDENKFFQVLHAGFAHKRKQLLPNLSEIYDRKTVEKAFGECGLDPKCRAEDISLENWLSLCKTL